MWKRVSKQHHSARSYTFIFLLKINGWWQSRDVERLKQSLRSLFINIQMHAFYSILLDGKPFQYQICIWHDFYLFIKKSSLFLDTCWLNLWFLSGILFLRLFFYKKFSSKDKLHHNFSPFIWKAWDYFRQVLNNYQFINNSRIIWLIPWYAK